MYNLSDEYIDMLLECTVPSYQLTCKETRNLGFGGIYYALTRALRPRRVVVIGSKAGFAPIIFAKAVKDNEGHSIKFVDCQATELHHPQGERMMHFIDPSYSVDRHENNHWYGIGTWDDPIGVENLWKKFGVEGFAKHYKMTSAEYLEQLPADDKIDLLFVDGDHSFKGMTHDFVQFHSKLSDNAMVLSHDVDPSFQAEYENEGAGGFKAFSELPDELYEKTRIPIYPGLAIMRKK